MKFSKHSFELVGYDFMVVPHLDGPQASLDAEMDGPDMPFGSGPNDMCSFKTRMIEANTNPCLEESN